MSGIIKNKNSGVFENQQAQNIEKQKKKNSSPFSQQKGTIQTSPLLKGSKQKAPTLKNNISQPPLLKSNNSFQLQLRNTQSQAYDYQEGNDDQTQFKCRVHTQQQLKHICLDQNCDHQRLMCSDCESTDHYHRHRNKCILLSELLDKQEYKLNMKNWPQDSYLRIFQDYLKGQTNQYEDKITDMCEDLLKFIQEQIDILSQTMLNLCSEVQQRNSDKNQKLINSYIEECSNLDQIRDLFLLIDEEQYEDNYKQYQQQTEKKISQIINDTLIIHTSYKQQLNQKYGFGYFQDKNAIKPLIDFNLVNSEFDSIKQSISQMCIFVEKNASIIKQMNSPRSSGQFSNNQYSNTDMPDSVENTESGFSAERNNTSIYDLSITTVQSESDKIIFRPDEKSAIVKKVSKPTFFFTNIMPQQTYFQIRLTGIVKCGTFIGLIDEDQKQIKINPQNQQQNHFVGICIACPNECYGNCKTKGPGISFSLPEQDIYENDEYMDDLRDKGPEVQTIILNIFINLTKKMIQISDISNEKYLKFDLDDKNYFYNRKMRLFVQTQEQMKFEVLQYSKV